MKPQAAARIIERLPQEVIFFGIMVLGRDGADVWRELEGLLDGLQVHGARDDAELAEFGDMPLLVAIQTESF